jgi:hypothetical protein
MATTKDRPVLWFRFRDDRRRGWRCFLTRPDITRDLGLDEKGAEDEGASDLTRRRIYVNANSPRSSWGTTALHEMNHAALLDTGFEGEEWEPIVDVHAVRMLPILESLGFRLPDPPSLPWRRYPQ